MKNRIKLIINIFLLVCMVIISSVKSFADTNIDKSGREFDFEYSEDFISMIYIHNIFTNDFYLHKKDFYDGAIIEEESDQPLLYRYFFEDDDLLVRERFYFQIYNWEFSYDSTAVKAAGKNFLINAGVKNTRADVMSYADDSLYEIGYEVSVKRLNDSENDDTYYMKKITEQNLNQAVPEILEINASVVHYDYTYLNTPVNIDMFHDAIDVYIFSSESDESVYAVNLDSQEESIERFDAAYDSEIGAYRFGITKPGVYTLIKGEFINKDTPEDESGSVIWLIIIIIATAVAVTAAIIITHKSRYNKNKKKSKRKR